MYKIYLIKNKKKLRRDIYMTKFVNQTTEEEDVLFAVFGKLKTGQDTKKSYLVKVGESLEGVITEIKESSKYGRIYTLKKKGEEKPIVVTGKTDLVKKMGHSTAKVPKVVKVNDLIQITFKGVTKTGKGNTYFDFDVGVAQ
jgi:hypothetical protein